MLFLGEVVVLKPSKMSCVRVERCVVVECCGRNPCCEGISGMCGVICLRMRLSKIFDMVQRREIGLYDDGSFTGLLIFKMGMMMPFFRCRKIDFVSSSD